VLWASVLRLWQRLLIRRAALVITVLSIPLLAFLIVGAFFYNHYSRVIDTQLQGGPFRDSVNIYGAPSTLNDGDALTADDVEVELRLAGYKRAGNGKPGSFQESSSGFVVTQLAGRDSSPVRVVMATGDIRGSGEIQRIEANGRDVKTWTVGYPLLENLSSGRQRRHMVTFQDLPPGLVNAVVSVEDKHFFHHQGLDLPRIAKAAYIDVREHSKEQGASTLTMQLVRGLWLQPEKRWKRSVDGITPAAS
jgi:penicillin-binding protein 1B